MKKIILLSLFIYSFSFGQEIKKTKTIDLEPSMRIGIVIPIHFGTNMITKEFNNNIGFTSNFSFLQVYNFKLSLGFEYQKYNETNSSIGIISHINKYNYSVQTDYTININQKYSIIPFMQYGSSNLNFKNINTIIAKQNGNEIKIGSYLDYKLNTTYSIYASFNFCKLFNDINASRKNEIYYASSNAFQIAVGLELN